MLPRPPDVAAHRTARPTPPPHRFPPARPSPCSICSPSGFDRRPPDTLVEDPDRAAPFCRVLVCSGAHGPVPRRTGTPRAQGRPGGTGRRDRTAVRRPHAFVRELVQNAIDAGATRVELAPGDHATFSVTDHGCGMDRSTIDGALLTLFRSSKEGVAGAIGRHGVGFVSVFALDPACVLVHTWRDGAAWLVRLQPDHSYELETDTPRQGSGPICILSPTPSVHAAVPEYAALWAFHDRCDRKSAPAQAWRELAVTGTETLQALQSMLQACSDRLDKADSDAWQCGLALLEIPSARVEARGPPTRPWCRSPALRSPSSTTCSSPSLTRRAKRPRSDDEEGLLRRIARASHVTAHTAPTRSPPRRMSRPIRASRTSIW